MNKTIKVSVTCPHCTTKLAVPVTENDLGEKKQGTCPKCGKKFIIPIPMSLASMFESDPTLGGNEAERMLLLEIVPNEHTAYQCFELTFDYYTIGRKNSGGPEYRPDVEVVTTDKKMSRKHAAIRKRGRTGFTIKDLGSKNGVFYNGVRMDTDEEMYLTDGDQFRIGETIIRVSVADQSMNSDDLTR